MKYLEEPYIYIWLLIGLIGISLNFSSFVAITFTAMILTAYLIQENFKGRLTLNAQKGNTVQSLIYAGIAWAVFLVIARLVDVFTQQGGFDTLNNIFKNWATTPIQATSIPLTIFVVGIFIPIVETILTINIFEAVCIAFNVNINFRNWKIYPIITAISYLWMWFHVNVLGIQNDAKLLLVFVFFFVTQLFAIFAKESEGPVWLHIFNNIVTQLRVYKII